MRTKEVIVRGKVQGVFFRKYTQQKAIAFGLKGWVKNLPDGSVQSLIIGTEAQLDQMVAWFHKGSPLSIVKEVIVKDAQLIDYAGFEILK